MDSRLDLGLTIVEEVVAELGYHPIPPFNEREKKACDDAIERHKEEDERYR